MTEDEKAAEAYAQKHNDPKIDWDVMTQEQTQALLERVSCDGCRHNFKALSLAFLAGVEHGRGDKKRAFVFGYQSGVLAHGVGNVQDPESVYELYEKIQKV